MSQEILMIDFDETLFDHRGYIDFLGRIIPDKLGVDPTDYLRTFDGFHDVMSEDGLLRLYRHKSHVKRTLETDWSYLSGIAAEAVAHYDMDFCYPDSHDFIEKALRAMSNVRILTYGREAYQRYKISLCPDVARLPVHVVERHKAEFLEEYFGPDSGIRGVLVDDKAPLDLPSNWQHVWINRHGQSRPEGYGCIEVDKLDFDQIAMATGLVGALY